MEQRVPLDLGPVLTTKGPKVYFRTNMPEGWASLLDPDEADRLALNLTTAAANARAAASMAEVAERLEIPMALVEHVLGDVVRRREREAGRADRITGPNGEDAEEVTR